MDLTSTSLRKSGGSDIRDSKKATDKGTATPVPRMATIRDDDERLLARIGYKQVRPWRSDDELIPIS